MAMNGRRRHHQGSNGGGVGMKEVNIKQDLERLFSGFRWNIKGFVDEEGNLYPVPEIPQLITGIFQEITKGKVKEFARGGQKAEG